MFFFLKHFPVMTKIALLGDPNLYTTKDQRLEPKNNLHLKKKSSEPNHHDFRFHVNRPGCDFTPQPRIISSDSIGCCRTGAGCCWMLAWLDASAFVGYKIFPTGLRLVHNGACIHKPI